MDLILSISVIALIVVIQGVKIFKLSIKLEELEYLYQELEKTNKWRF